MRAQNRHPGSLLLGHSSADLRRPPERLLKHIPSASHRQTSAPSEFSLSGPCPRVCGHQAGAVKLISKDHLPQASSNQRPTGFQRPKARLNLARDCCQDSLKSTTSDTVAKTPYPSSTTNCWPQELLHHTSPLPRVGRHVPTPGSQGVTEVEGLEPQLPRRTVQVIEGKKRRLGSELKGPQSRAPAQRERTLPGL